MKLSDGIKKIIELCNRSQNGVGTAVGYKSGTWATIMKRNNMQVKTLVAIANELGYEVVLRPKDGKNKEERSVVIDKVGDVE